MSQTQEAAKKTGVASPDTLPDSGQDNTAGITPAQASNFVATGQEKVELDLEDAPFLKEDLDVLAVDLKHLEDSQTLFFNKLS